MEILTKNLKSLSRTHVRGITNRAPARCWEFDWFHAQYHTQLGFPDKGRETK